MSGQWTMVWESGLKESQQSCNRQRQFGDKKVIPWVYKAFFQLESGRRLEQPPRQCERSQHSGRVQTLLQAAPRDHSGTRNRRMKGDQETKVPPSYNILIRTRQWTAEDYLTSTSTFCTVYIQVSTVSHDLFWHLILTEFSISGIE